MEYINHRSVLNWYWKVRGLFWLGGVTRSLKDRRNNQFVKSPEYPYRYYKWSAITEAYIYVLNINLRNSYYLFIHSIVDNIFTLSAANQGWLEALIKIKGQ